MRNTSAKLHSAAVCSVPFVLYGGAGAGFFMSWIIYCAACAVASADGVCGIGNLYGGGFYCVTDSCCSCFININLVEVVIFHCWP